MYLLVVSYLSYEERKTFRRLHDCFVHLKNNYKDASYQIIKLKKEVKNEWK